ncbi:conjugative transposon protein TraN [Dyadobacter psychrotolerans]|uniref:Conjugative transposon protein TraN n=1 Tax=Dyadobacter psychrotolerans TaxID=2541721 RepID=A0A4R5DFJ2_9BACT|nr:conjugative transposon protein TraN [Dyadobacter psychrotolerans]TDE10730.1 conjugative transposon protein TraN [Dyadobacter psychrotolerans]
MKILQISLAKTVLLLLTTISYSQPFQLYSIEPYPLEITFHKTVNIIFPFAIKSVDKGSAEVLAQKASGIENILQLKAANTTMHQTNLTVITADGKLHSFLVNYADDPLQLNIELLAEQPAIFNGSKADEITIRQTAQSAALLAPNMRSVKAKTTLASLKLSGIFVADEIFYLQLTLTNRARVSYDAGNWNLFVADNKKLKRAAQQQQQIKPLFVHMQASSIAAQSSQTYVIAITKMGLVKGKRLCLQINENHGERNLQLTVSARKLLNAKAI